MAGKHTVLKIENLTVAYRSGDKVLEAVRDFDLEIGAGQVYGLVGESGSGKTTLANAVMGYLGRDGFVKAGDVHVGGQSIGGLSEAELRGVWARDLAHVPQNPFTALNPSLRVGDQVVEVLQVNETLKETMARQRVLALFKRVRLSDPERVFSSFPHQISGGMQQRVMIAMALSKQPSLLVLDEPTTALDVTTQAAVLDLVRELSAEKTTSVLYVTHNLSVVAGLTDRVAVIYAGELVEDAPTVSLYRQPLHPYTRGLLDSVPRLGQRKDVKPLQGIAGQIPALDELPQACIFAPRCPLAIDLCWEERPALEAPIPGRKVRCHRWPEILAGELNASRQAVAPIVVEAYASQPLLAVKDIEVAYPVRRSLLQALRGAPAKEVSAVRGVSLQAGRRETIGIVGESGSGKSSLARAVVGLVERKAGDVAINGIALPADLKSRSMETLTLLQMIFQNPEEALNPYLRVGESLRRPLRRLLGLSAEAADARAKELLEMVRLPINYVQRLPSQLSGGEKQRVAMARAFASHPALLIADEAVSALDVSVQAAILNLLAQLQIEHESAMLFIAHDIAVVGYLADQIAVMYLGELMQTGPAEDIFTPPYHPYTEALLSAVPPPDPDVGQEKIRLPGEVPSAVDLPGGCPFHTRCPRFLGDVCVEQTPPWQETNDGRRIFCHIPIKDLETNQLPVLRFGEVQREADE